MTLQIATVGIYGFSEERFINALKEAGVTTICDVRARRGMRGRTYAFANSVALQRSLGAHGIGYVHCKDLAPSEAIRSVQRQADKRGNTQKRERRELAPEFVSRYEQDRLSAFNAQAFLSTFPQGTVAFLCVEGEPQACHRSLLASFLAAGLGTAVKHIVP
jgi:uncharacterized protein (DUF488 family)